MNFYNTHSATKRMSVSCLYLASDISSTGNDKDILELSTNEFKSHVCVTVGRSFVYIQKSSGDKIAPCGKPCVIERAVNRDDPMRTF